MAKTLFEIKKKLKKQSLVADKKISFENIEIDSRKVTKDDIFLARKGKNHDALDFLDEVIKKGVKLVILSENYSKKGVQSRFNDKDITFFYIPSTVTEGEFINWFYDYPSKKLRLIGVTGTNGKSTVTHLVATMLDALGFKCAVFGTLGYGFLPNLNKSSNTTLDLVYLCRALDEYQKDGAQFATLEVSSIGVCEGRIDGLSFSCGAFTNLTRDHLDYHETMEDYQNAKESFLDRVNPHKVVINEEDSVGSAYLRKTGCSVLYTTKKSELKSITSSPFVELKKVTYKENGFIISANASSGILDNVEVNLLGKINVSNFLCAVAILQTLNISLKDISSVVDKIKAIPGRMECYLKEGKPRIIVDYAHTPDGVEKALVACKEHCNSGKVICVVGCGGDRDKGKRPQMAMKASIYSDMAIFTEDNPRTENPLDIIEDMKTGVSLAKNVEIILDRHEAINKAYSLANEKDIILIAGKGHEDYQIFKDKTIHFSDREEAQKLLEV